VGNGAAGYPLLATKLFVPRPRPDRIRIRGHLDPAWSAWLDSLTITRERAGTTELTGPLADQAALFGLLARLRDLGATLLLVERLAEEAGIDHRRSTAKTRCP
jgi:hypothetical protein